MKTEFVPVEYDYFDYKGKNYIRLIGRDKQGEKILVIDEYEANFWVILEEKYSTKTKAESIAKKISTTTVEGTAKRTTKVEKTQIHKKKYLGKEVTAIRVYVTNHKDAHDLAIEISNIKGIQARREYDIPLITKYIKEDGLLPLQWHEVELEEFDPKQDYNAEFKRYELKNYYTLKKKKLLPDKTFSPRILTYDLEAENMDPSKGDLLSIGLYGEKYKKVITWKKHAKPAKYIHMSKNETGVLEDFVDEVKLYDPDIIVGYFSDGFDLPFLKAIAQLNKGRFDIGLDGKGPSFTRGRIPSGKINGIVHIDLFRFIDAVYSQYLQSETLGLGSVAAELVGETKEDFDWNKIGNMKDKDWKDLLSYNLQDARVTYLLAEKLWPDMVEFSKIIQEPLFDITRKRMASHVENYIIHNIDAYDEIIEKKPVGQEIGRRRAMGAFEGAFVFQPEPGLYKDLVMFDFTSMYPSVIITYNLSKTTHIQGTQDKFSKKQGFFPAMLKEVLERRKKYKRIYAKEKTGLAKARSNAYKLLANAAYGYQAFSGARYYCREAAATTAKLARENIKKTIKAIEKEGHDIIYSDTDSIAFSQEHKNEKEILTLLENINKELPGMMELDLEDFFTRAIFVTNRAGTSGAKKKYALLSKEGEIKIRGFETVRRDWCNLARWLQNEVLALVLEEGNEKKALELLKETVKALKTRQVEKELLIIKTQLRKSLDRYQARGPHVAAAEKMIKKGQKVGSGDLIHYYIGEINGKAKRISDKVFLPEEEVEYDIDYYLNNQVLPAVENIFDVFEVKVKEVLDGESQKTLF